MSSDFERVLAPRQTNALKALELMQNLTAKRGYLADDDRREAVLEQLYDAVDAVALSWDLPSLCRASTLQSAPPVPVKPGQRVFLRDHIENASVAECSSAIALCMTRIDEALVEAGAMQ